MDITDVNGFALLLISIMHCKFTSINSSAIIETHVNKVVPSSVLKVNIHNTSFSKLKDAKFVIGVEGIILMLIGPVIFTNIVNHVAIIYLANSRIIINSHITFSLNQANCCIVMGYMTLVEQTKLT